VLSIGVKWPPGRALVGKPPAGDPKLVG